ncbi:MAG: PRC-barrel domain containing protein [Rhizobiales bacterium]|nr:PRC-barrel domain containing protein [Hyphomicrobiales bacterium]
MKHSLITATAIGLILGAPALADTTYLETPAEGALQASNLIGKRIYATENDVDEATPLAAGGEADWDDIGEINDIVVTRDGAVQAVVLGVGGFLGVGEKNVAVDMASLKFVVEQDDPDDFFLVVNSSKALLENAPAFVSRETEAQIEAVEEQRQDMAANTEGAAPAEDAASARPMLTPPDVQREGYEDARLEDLTAEMLQGRSVYGPEDENVGEIGELILNDGGQITEAVIDIGGFLGIGERNVAVSFDELRILREGGGDDLRVYIDSTEEQLERLPEHQG